MPEDSDDDSGKSNIWITVGQYTSLAEAYDHGLVILAMGESCRVSVTEKTGAFILEMEANPLPRILHELASYTQENQQPEIDERRSMQWAAHPSSRWSAALWAISLLVVFVLQDRDSTLVRRGASSSIDMISYGHWWRPFSALFLHADIGHLAGNIVGGVIFGNLVAKMLGSILGWLLIIFCGAAANALTAWIAFPEAFRSIGASTAVFAALGILAGCGVVETVYSNAKRYSMKLGVPFIAGIVVLGLLGGGQNAQTDVLGHVMGFTVGLIAGIFAAVVHVRRRSSESPTSV